MNNTKEELQEKFNRLAKQWNEETSFHSSLQKIVDNDAYREIIAMGSPVISLILEDLEKGPNHWFYALYTLTGADAAAGKETVEGARQKWLAWGQEEKFIQK